MTSRSLFFRLMREDLKRRIWAVALIGLGCFFVFPVMAAFLAGNIKDYDIYEEGLAVYTSDLAGMFSFENGFTVFGMIICALICGLSGFSYLNNRSKVDFYHGIPVRREKIYAANYLNGILITAVPYGIFLVLGVIIGIANGASGSILWPTALVGYCLHMTYYILGYAVVVIAAMMTGHLVVGFLGCMVFAGVVPLAVSLIQGYFCLFYDTYVPEKAFWLYRWGVRLSPLTEYVIQFDQYDMGEPVVPAALGALVVSAALAGFGCFLYRKRPSEAAGKAMAFRVSRPLICITLTTISSLGLGAFLWGIRNSMAWAIFGQLCGAVICHTVIQVIYHFDFKKLFSCKLQLFGCIVASLAVLFVFRYDLTGYDSYVPKAGDVKSVAVDVHTLERWVSYGSVYQTEQGEWRWDDQNSFDYVMEHMQYQDIENTLELVEEGIREMEEYKLIRQNGEENYAEQETASGYETYDGQITDEAAHMSEVIVRYTLNSGRKVYRKYRVVLENVRPQIEKMMSDPGFLQGAYPLMSQTADRLSSVRYREGNEEITLDALTVAEKEALLNAYQEEFASLSMTRMYREAPVGLIRFTSEDEESAIRWTNDRIKREDEERRMYGYVSQSTYDSYGRGGYGYYEDALTRDYYPVYPSFTKTLQLLKEQKVDAGSYSRGQVRSVDVFDYRSEKDGAYTKDVRLKATFVDPEEIRKLMEVVEDERRLYYNPFYLQDDMVVTLNISENGEVYGYDAVFPSGKVPAFVTNRLEKID